MTLRVIYGLLDPRTDEIRYIGKSSSGLKRPYSHFKPGSLQKDDTHKGRWLKKLTSEGVTCRILILEEVLETDDLSDRERWWISFGRSEGWPLTNLTEGGEGLSGMVFSQEHRAKISASNKGRRLTEETKTKLSAVAKGRRLSDDHKKKLLASRPTVVSEETRKKLGAVHRGKVVSEHTRKKIAVARKVPVVDKSTGIVYPSQKDAAHALGLCLRSVGRVLRGSLKQTGGHTFSYASET